MHANLLLLSSLQRCDGDTTAQKTIVEAASRSAIGGKLIEPFACIGLGRCAYFMRMHLTDDELLA